jgi:hypothetical protein
MYDHSNFSKEVCASYCIHQKQGREASKSFPKGSFAPVSSIHHLKNKTKLIIIASKKFFKKI